MTAVLPSSPSSLPLHLRQRSQPQLSSASSVATTIETANSNGPGDVANPPPAKIWWSNSIFFVGTHVAALVGMYYRPPSSVPRATLALFVVVWQAACFGITIGYHRLYSHRAFRATIGVRIVLAALGSLAFQGSIKWWCLRHRLHHRFTDDPLHDPYSATRGLLFSHMGWIFYKPSYPKLSTIDRTDLERDPVVRFQHKYYVPLALFFGLVMPTCVGWWGWGDALGSWIYGGLVARLAIWHCTFLVNSLAHWDGLQPYSDENTSRGNFIMALLTCGEGNHNYHHAFPQDFRAEPSLLAWDPSKWIILLMDWAGWVYALRRAREEDVCGAREYMRMKIGMRRSGKGGVGEVEVSAESSYSSASSEGEDEVSSFHASDSSSSSLSSSSLSSSVTSLSPLTSSKLTIPGKVVPIWNEEQLMAYVRGDDMVTPDAEGDPTEGRSVKTKKCVLVIDGFVVDVSLYLGEHPGGASLLRAYAVPVRPLDTRSQPPPPPPPSERRTSPMNNPNPEEERVKGACTESERVECVKRPRDGEEKWRKATWAFAGGMNNHSRAARARLGELSVATVVW
ncbi:hypothetical protein BD410DRAFT_323717 [Rickenella mellea]|uniref:Fatty acid desaturase domain-containing protein n=1 Tax=Rickenella mellea TaxID=50990 RepID=A0A4Y7Q114_9AGAM|nr:hypothetical protein BD410DRAFT_323717 [Rickenella mellea]